MSFQVSDCYAGITGLLMNRTVSNGIMQEAMRKAVLEFTTDYKHPLLEATGPIVSFVPFQSNYAASYFMQSADAALDLSKVNSFFLYNNPFIAPSSDNSQTNAGYDLKFRSIKDIEVLLNIPGLPIYWSRNNNQLWFGSMPDNAYNTYMRYQKEHPSANTPGGFASNPQIMMSDEWQDMLEYAAAMRIAPQVNLASKRVELREALYGDEKFQQSSGIEGAPGLIFQRTSQRNRDQATTTRRLRLRMGGV